MIPTLAIAIVAFVPLLWVPGAAAKRRRVGGGGGGSYCVDDQNHRVLCGDTIGSIVGAVISGICSLNHLCPGTAHLIVLTYHFLPVLLGILYCIGLALWRRRRFQRGLRWPKTAAAEDHPETSTIASGSTFHDTTGSIVEPAPAHMKFQHAEPYKPNVAPVGTYAAPQGPPTV